MRTGLFSQEPLDEAGLPSAWAGPRAPPPLFLSFPSLLYGAEPSPGGAGESMGKAEEELAESPHSFEGDGEEPLPNAGTEYG